ncbi:TPA: streptococcal pyrogenic exotoxin SpeL, partial [Streptococcus pyogenes]
HQNCRLVNMSTTFFIVVLSLMVFSVRMVSAEGTINIKDIYSPRWDVDKTLSPTTLREIYNRDTIKKVNKPITGKRGTQVIMDAQHKTKVWEFDDYNFIISSNLHPSVEGKFNVGDNVDVFGLALSAEVFSKDQIHSINGGLVKVNERKGAGKTIYMNVFIDGHKKDDTSKYKITFEKSPVTFQEVDVRLRKSFMLNDEIKLYQYDSKVLSGNWEFHGSGEKEEGADLFKYPDYRYNNLIDIDKKSHIDVYLFTNKEN